jgi:hypothetical protein
MHETNWTARIIFSVIGVVVLGVLVLGYVRSTRPPVQQHYEQSVAIAPG